MVLYIQNNFLNAGKNIYVANAGVMGQTTFGHIENFNSWFNHIPDLKPDYFYFILVLMIFTKEIQQSMISRYASKKGITLLKTYIAEKVSLLIYIFF